MGGRKNDNRLENRLNISHIQKRSKDKRENYTGINLLPQIRKILSSVLYDGVVKYTEYQNGFRSGR